MNIFNIKLKRIDNYFERDFVFFFCIYCHNIIIIINKIKPFE